MKKTAIGTLVRCIDYLVKIQNERNVNVVQWDVTKKSLVYRDLETGRHIVPLDQVK